MGRNENDVMLQQSADAQKDMKLAGAKAQTEAPSIDKSAAAAAESPSRTSASGSDEQYDTQTEEMITNAWEKTRNVAENALHAAEGAWEKTKGAAVAVKETIVGKPHANDEVARGKKNDDASNAIHEAAAAAAGEHQAANDETLKEKVQHIAGAAWGKTKEVAEVAWEKTRETAIAVKDKVIHEETPAANVSKPEGGAIDAKIPDAPSITPSLPSDAHPIAPTNQRNLQIDRKQLKVPVKSPADIEKAELPKDATELHADFEKEQLKAPMRSDGGIGQVPPVSELTFGGGEPAKEGEMF